MSLRPEHPISQLESSINNAIVWIQNDIEHYLKGKGKSKTMTPLGSYILFEKNGILITRFKEIVTFIGEEGLKDKAKPFLDSIEKNIKTGSDYFSTFYDRFIGIEKIRFGSKERTKEIEDLENEIANPLIALINKMRADLSSIKKLI